MSFSTDSTATLRDELSTLFLSYGIIPRSSSLLTNGVVFTFPDGSDIADEVKSAMELSYPALTVQISTIPGGQVVHITMGGLGTGRERACKKCGGSGWLGTDIPCHTCKNTGIVEHGMSRVLRNAQATSDGKHSYAVLTSWRADKPKSENEKNLKDLQQHLRSKGLGWTNLNGKWVDHKTGKQGSEPSMMVNGISKSDAHDIMKKHNQDAVIYSGPETKGHAHLINNDDSEVNLGRIHPDKVADNYSQLKSKGKKRTFTFESVGSPNSYHPILLEDDKHPHAWKGGKQWAKAVGEAVTPIAPMPDNKPPTDCEWYNKQGFCRIDGKPCPYSEKTYQECPKWDNAQASPDQVMCVLDEERPMRFENVRDMYSRTLNTGSESLVEYPGGYTGNKIQGDLSYSRNTDVYIIRYVNLGYNAQPIFTNLQIAIAYGKEKGFEFAIDNTTTGKTVCGWNPLHGLTWFDPSERTESVTIVSAGTLRQAEATAVVQDIYNDDRRASEKKKVVGTKVTLSGDGALPAGISGFKDGDESKPLRPAFYKKQKTEAAIQNHNSSGQGHDPDHHTNKYHDTLERHGYSYSHSTPVHIGDYVTNHHTYAPPKDGMPHVGVYTTKQGTEVWDAHKLGSGRHTSGKYSEELSKYLVGAKKRTPKTEAVSPGSSPAKGMEQRVKRMAKKSMSPPTPTFKAPTTPKPAEESLSEIHARYPNGFKRVSINTIGDQHASFSPEDLAKPEEGNTLRHRPGDSPLTKLRKTTKRYLQGEDIDAEFKVEENVLGEYDPHRSYEDDAPEPDMTDQYCPFCRRTMLVFNGFTGEHDCPSCGWSTSDTRKTDWTPKDNWFNPFQKPEPWHESFKQDTPFPHPKGEKSKFSGMDKDRDVKAKKAEIKKKLLALKQNRTNKK